MKKLLLIAIKWGVSLAILAFLCVQAYQHGRFAELIAQPKRWSLLASAVAIYFVALSITLVRWWLLVRVLELRLTLRGAFRLGLLGFLFNLAPMGIVGGDLLKAFLLAHGQEGRRADALASVAVDRAIGLLVLLIVASVAIPATGLLDTPEQMRLAYVAWGVTVAGIVATLSIMGPDMTGGRWTGWLDRIPYVGKPLRRLVESLRAYRHHLATLWIAVAMSVAVHLLLATSVYFMAAGLYSPSPSLAMHCVMVPMSLSTMALPINIGPFEFVLNELYARIPLADGDFMRPGQGFVVALGYRIVTVFCAALGIVYYLTGRREVAEAMHEEAEAEQAGEI